MPILCHGAEHKQSSFKFEQTTNAAVLWRGKYAFHVHHDRSGFFPNAKVDLEQDQKQKQKNNKRTPQWTDVDREKHHPIKKNVKKL